jgi:hypothetical protein
MKEKESMKSEKLLAEMKTILKNSSPSLSQKNIEWKGNLGKGNFGVVQEIVSKKSFALKQIDLKNLVDKLSDEEELCEELSNAFSEFQIMRKNHPNVVRSYQYHFDNEKLIFSFTMDLMIEDLGKLIQKRIIPFKEFYPLFQDIVTGKNTRREKYLNVYFLEY